MHIHSPSQDVLTKPNVLTAITAAANNGTGVDTLTFRRAQAIFYSAPSGVGTTSDCKLQDSADNSSFADVATAAFAQVTTAGGTQLQVMDIDLAKRRRYLRLVHTGAGGSAAGQAVGIIQLFRAEYLPVAQDNTPVSV